MRRPSLRTVPALAAGLLAAGLALGACGGSSGAGAPVASSSVPSSSVASSSAPGSSSVRPSVSSSAAAGYYLSLGDSVAFGYQQAKLDTEVKAHDYSAASFDTGYTDRVAAALRQQDPALVTANLSCPGETTHTYLAGRCPFSLLGFALHTRYTGSQAAAATAFLAKHPGPGVITMSLGANDINAILRQCPSLATSCVLPKTGPVLTGVQTNLTTAFRALRAAAPQATIVTLQLYDPYAVVNPAADILAAELNERIAAAAATSGVKLADALPVFNPTTNEKATVCRLTAFCTPLHDIHPTDAGYADIAQLMLAQIRG